jgi:hypothetical protein
MSYSSKKDVETPGNCDDKLLNYITKMNQIFWMNNNLLAMQFPCWYTVISTRVKIGLQMLYYKKISWLQWTSSNIVSIQIFLPVSRKSTYPTINVHAFQSSILITFLQNTKNTYYSRVQAHITIQSLIYVKVREWKFKYKSFRLGCKLPEKYKENFDVSSEDPLSGS